jgi:predicted benzoate:H+ symporter BenE
MAWKIQNILSNVLSPLLFIGMIVAYVYSELNKVGNAFFYILLVGTVISTISGTIVNIMELNDTRKN